jgi:hypothetical protein
MKNSLLLFIWGIPGMAIRKEETSDLALMNNWESVRQTHKQKHEDIKVHCVFGDK